MKMIKSKTWLGIYLLFNVVILGGILGAVIYIDPFMHYHKPYTEEFFYGLDNPRSMNDGIIKHFDYDAVIIGTSMTENFKTSEFDALFERNSIKVPFAGGTYKEINQNVKTILETHKNVKTIVRCLDTDAFFDDKDAMRTDLGEYPVYLYNNNPIDDVFYVLNRDVLYTRCWNMLMHKYEGGSPGITSFDDYTKWPADVAFGKNAVLQNHPDFSPSALNEELTEAEKLRICDNIEMNVTMIADEYPDVDFYYFFPPYSAVWWGNKVNSGLLDKEIQAEKVIIEKILQYKNIHLFSWNDQFNLTTDLNNYRDDAHYGKWVNSWMLTQMWQGHGIITANNYEDYLKREYDFYRKYNYNELYYQTDYSTDDYAMALVKGKEDD